MLLVQQMGIRAVKLADLYCCSCFGSCALPVHCAAHARGKLRLLYAVRKAFWKTRVYMTSWGSQDSMEYIQSSVPGKAWPVTLEQPMN